MFRFGKTWQVVVFALFLVLVATMGAVLRSCLRRQLVSQTSKVEFRPDWENSVELVEGKPGTVRVLPEAVEVLGLRTEVLQPIRDTQRLEFSGTLALEPGCRSYVHARFAGEIVEVGPVRPGDRVAQGDLLAVLWSRELGEKKGELIDALAELQRDQQTLERLSGSTATGDRSRQEVHRKVAADRLAVARATRTLEIWRIAAEDLDALRREATELAASGAREKSSARLARWEVRAPWAGVVLEANAALGEMVDAHATLFRIADLARLQVIAQVGDDDLPKLDTLPSDRRTWQIRPTTDPEADNRPGRFERIGALIDSKHRTAPVFGWVDNTEGTLRIGQSVTIQVEIPPSDRQVVVSPSALLDDGQRQVVFLQPDPEQTVYVARQVAVAWRARQMLCLSKEPNARQRGRGAIGVEPGQRVVVAGAAELMAALTELGGTVSAK